MLDQKIAAREKKISPQKRLLSDGLDYRDFLSGPFWQVIPDYKLIQEDEFNSYAFQTKQSLTNSTPVAREKLLSLVAKLAGSNFAKNVERGLRKAPMSVQLTPYIISLIDWQNPLDCEVRKQFLPVASALLQDHPLVGLDSLGEKSDTKAEGLVHRYFDRALFLPQTTCPVYCRYCTRSYAIGSDTETVHKFHIEGTPKVWQSAFDYIRRTPQIEDIVLSGGDCYNLHPRLLENIAENLLGIEHVKRIRIATKGLAVNPGRILKDAKWTNAVIQFVERGRKLGKHVVIHTHINSAKEITWITQKAMKLLFESGVTVRNQSVLLRGVNDSPLKMANLIKKLGYLQIQPYYVFQHDLVAGVDDLRTPLSSCLSIEHALRGLTAGFNTPHFVVDTPGGGGKRIASTYDYYDPETGISVYSAPAVKPDIYFLYFDPLHALNAEIVERWADPVWRNKVCKEAIDVARTFRPSLGGPIENSFYS